MAGALGLGLAVAFGLGRGEGAQARPPSGAIRIGVVGTLFRDTPEPVVQALLHPMRKLMELQTGLNGQFITVPDYDNLGGQLVQNKVQLAVFHGFEFAWARQKYPALRPLDRKSVV